jgi:hypothetical protein
MEPAAELAATSKPSPKTLMNESPPKIVTIEIAAEASVKPAAPKESGTKERPAVKAMEPRPRADEHAANKPLRPVVAVRRTRVRVITIVAVGTYRRRSIVSRPIVSRANSYAHEHSLRTRKRGTKEADAEYRCNS